MKPNKDFKLSKSSKRVLATLPAGTRGHWKSMMINAEMAEKRAKLAKLTMKSNQGDE